jgi:hypothetical protein
VKVKILDSSCGVFKSGELYDIDFFDRDVIRVTAPGYRMDLAPSDEGKVFEFVTGDQTLSRRDQFAMAAMQGLLSHRDTTALGYRLLAVEATKHADAQIAELDNSEISK